MDTSDPNVELTWTNVGLAFSFVVFNVVIATVFDLGIGSSLLTAAIRCVAQLAVMATLLRKVFATENPWAVASIAFLLNFMGTFETVVNQSKRRYKHMFPSVLIGMLGSTIPVSIIGTRFAMSVDPFWEPIQYIPILGMLCGSTISGMVVSISSVLRELQCVTIFVRFHALKSVEPFRENGDKVEMYLAFGASRMEACKPIAIAALRFALTPTINQMSVIGIISIPGMMTGAILGGSSVERAAKLQMIIMFMISSSTALASLLTTISVIAVVVDGEHRIRSDRVDGKKHIVWRARERLFYKAIASFKGAVLWVKGKVRRQRITEEESQILLR